MMIYMFQCPSPILKIISDAWELYFSGDFKDYISGPRRWCYGKEPASQCRRHKRLGFDPWVGKIPLEKEAASHSSILAWRIPWILHSVAKSWTQLK